MVVVRAPVETLQEGPGDQVVDRLRGRVVQAPQAADLVVREVRMGQVVQEDQAVQDQVVRVRAALGAADAAQEAPETRVAPEDPEEAGAQEVHPATGTRVRTTSC